MTSQPNQNNLLPVFISAERLNILVIGGGKEAAERITSINNSFSVNNIRVVSENISNNILEIVSQSNNVEFVEKKISAEDFQQINFAFVCEERSDFHDLKNSASKASAFIHFSHHPELSDFDCGIIVDKGKLKIAFVTNDVAPSISEKIKNTFNEIIPDEIDELLGNLSRVKDKSKREFREKVSAINKFTKEVNKQDGYVDPYSELENTTKIVKAAQLKSNVYLGVIGALIIFGLFFLTIYEFNLFPDVKSFLNQDGKIFYWMLLVGFLAEIVAGSMGMGYGVICTTILLLLNVPPPIVSASIHSAESFTTAAGSISHFKLKNVNMKLVKSLAPYAVVGAVIGALLLTYLGEHYASIVKPIISLYTLYLGARILKKSLQKKENYKANRKKSNLKVLGLAGGFIDSFAGGGWGPLVTGSLIKDGRTPRYVVGSSTLAKFILTITSAITFVFTIGIHHWNIVLGLLLGGIITAPFSAMLTSRLPVKKMTIAISILVIVMSLITIGKALLK